MNKFKNESGFTLIEIIVVLIIIGVLASIALPNLFSNVTRSRAAEGIAALGPYKESIEGCISGHPGSEAVYCSALSQQNSANFSYAFGTSLTNGSSGGNYTLVGHQYKHYRLYDHCNQKHFYQRLYLCRCQRVFRRVLALFLVN